MMGLVPFATPQTFSRIVVFPAFALPITRMRKCGHLYRSLSTFIFSSLISDRHQSIFTDIEARILTYLLKQDSGTSPRLSLSSQYLSWHKRGNGWCVGVERLVVRQEVLYRLWEMDNVLSTRDRWRRAIEEPIKDHWRAWVSGRFRVDVNMGDKQK